MRILFDTSFFLPTIGIEVENKLLKECLRKLEAETGRNEHFLTQINLIELCWIFLRKTRVTKAGENQEVMLIRGMESIAAHVKDLSIPTNSYVRGLKLKQLGHPDLFDCVLYSVAEEREIYFLSVDSTFDEFLRTNDLSGRYFLFGEDYLQMT